MDTQHFIHLLVKLNLDCSHLLASKNDTAINTHVQVVVWT